MKINGKTHYLWRAVGYEGDVLDSYVTKTRDKTAAMKLLRKAMKRYGSPLEVVADHHINRRQTFKSQRDAALLEWRQLLAALEGLFVR